MVQNWWYLIWYDMIYDMILYDIWYDICYDMISHDMTWYMIWYDMIWYDILSETIYDMICDMMWYNPLLPGLWNAVTIWYDTIYVIYTYFRCACLSIPISQLPVPKHTKWCAVVHYSLQSLIHGSTCRGFKFVIILRFIWWKIYLPIR